MRSPANPDCVSIEVEPLDLAEASAALLGAGFVLDAETGVRPRLTLRRQPGVCDDTAAAGWAATLPAGIAHEINNPLSAVIANLELAEETLSHLLLPASKAASPSTSTPAKQSSSSAVSSPGDELPRPLAAVIRQLDAEVKDALSAARHVQLLVRDARAALIPVESEPVDVSKVVDLAIRMASTQVRTRAHLVREHGEAPLVQSTTLRLAQVFLNLIINAAQAIAPGRPEQHEIRITTATDEAGWAKVTVSDSGAGIEPEHLPRVFSAFFSTKSRDRSSGL
ncbi:MAG TPA: ATP-binding protein, partial [Polyangia bacterium]